MSAASGSAERVSLYRSCSKPGIELRIMSSTYTAQSSVGKLAVSSAQPRDLKASVRASEMSPPTPSSPAQLLYTCTSGGGEK